MKTSILGTGAMGARMAQRLIASGEHEVTVWNRTAERVGPLVEAGARQAATPAEAVRGQDVVLSMVRDDEAARQVWLDPDSGALPAMARGSVAVDCSTVTPHWARKFAARCAQHEVACLDAPVVGSRPQAEAGALIFLVGGDPAVLERVEPVLTTIGAAAHHAGAHGTGAQLKLVVNALFAVQVAAAAELLAGLHGTDLDPARAAEVLAATPVASPAIAAASGAMLRRAFAPAFPIDLVVKDLRYVADDAATRRVPLPLVDAAAGTYQRAAAQGYAEQNITGVVQLYHP